MATMASSLSFSRLSCGGPRSSSSSSSVCSAQPSLSNLSFPLRTKPNTLVSRRSRTMTLSCSASFPSPGDSASYINDEKSRSKRQALDKLTKEIEPLDTTLIQKDVSPDTVDAMKRIITEMLGLLPSGKFHVHIESPWEHLSKMLMDSIMTGYTLKNAEYRLFLEKNLELDYDSSSDKQEEEEIPSSKLDTEGKKKTKKKKEAEFEELTTKSKQFVVQMKSRLLSLKQELLEIQRRLVVLKQLKQLIGEDENEKKNYLLEYLRSLNSENLVSQLSEPSCPAVIETVHSVVNALSNILSPEMYPDPAGQIIYDASERQIFLTKDYLGRLLFWCMLLGHYIRGFEYRMELKELMDSSSGDNVEKSVSSDDE